jgi:hypothetical protein
MRKSALSVAALALLVAARSEAAEPAADKPGDGGAVDVKIAQPAPPSRFIAVEWNPIALIFQKLMFDVEIVPIEHHALIINPFLFHADTAPYLNQNATDASGNPQSVLTPRQTFEGGGADLGYRYYAGRGGPRGFFVDGVFVIAAVTGSAYDGSHKTFADLGLGADVGYQALVADDWSISLGAGLQYIIPTASIPDQQPPAWLYANNGLQPRLQLAFGRAF